MNSPLQKEFNYYLEHQNELVEQFDGKYIVIKNCTVIGDYDDELTAIDATKLEHELGTFLIQLVSQGTKDYSATFHSRVAFS